MTKLLYRVTVLLALPLLLSAFFAALPLFAGRASAQDSTGKSFVEDFADLDEKRWFVSDGWNNGGFQGCTWARARIHKGQHGINLELSDAPAKDRPYTCAEIQTTKVYGYGTYEARMRTVANPGVVTAFFTFIGPVNGLTAPHDEIDFEFLGKDPHAVQLNYFSNGKGHHEYMARFDFNASENFNDYAFEWLPDRIRWFINGKLVHEEHAKEGERFPSQPGKIFLSLWLGVGKDMEPWLDKFTYPGKALVASYEYVAFTKLGDPCQFPASLVCKTKLGSSAP